MAHDLKGDLDPMLNALTQMYRAANFGADATSITVPQLRDVMNQLHSNFNIAKTAWTDAVNAVGGTEARNVLAARIAPTPADVDAALSAIQTDCLAVLNAYNGSTYANPGAAAWTYSAALSGGLITGGHTDESVAAGTVTTLNGLCSTLRTSLLALAPVE